MRLLRILEPINNPDWIFERNIDRLHTLARIQGHHCAAVVSRNGYTFTSWPQLAEAIAPCPRRGSDARCRLRVEAVDSDFFAEED